MEPLVYNDWDMKVKQDATDGTTTMKKKVYISITGWASFSSLHKSLSLNEHLSMKLLFISILTLLSTSFAVSEELLTAEVFTYEKTLSALQSDTVQFRQLSLLSDTSVWHCVLENGKDITAEGKLQLSTKDETKSL